MHKLVKSKLFQLLAVVFLMACIILTGTYAWNDFMGRGTVNIPTLASDQMALMDFSDQMGEIYAVNNGREGMALRIKLLQYLDSGGVSVVPGSLEDDPSTWATAGNAAIQQYYRLVMGRAVLTMEDWKRQGAPQGDYWVADVDGWYYYARRLPAGEATRILLQEITENQFNVLMGGNYRINAVMQAVTKADLPDLLALDRSSFTDDGRLLMRYVCGEMIEFTKDVDS